LREEKKAPSGAFSLRGFFLPYCSQSFLILFDLLEKKKYWKEEIRA